MAHGQNAKKRFGLEWWGRRPMSSELVSANRGMKKEKRLCHKMERQINKRIIRNELKEL